MCGAWWLQGSFDLKGVLPPVPQNVRLVKVGSHTSTDCSFLSYMFCLRPPSYIAEGTRSRFCGASAGPLQRVAARVSARSGRRGARRPPGKTAPTFI